MRIALCDCDITFIEKIKRIIYNYAELFRIDIVADCYDSGENLLNSKINYDMIFLGYKLYGINGFKTAEILRRINSNATIIFISEYTDFIFDSFKVNPYRFLVKPISSDTVFEVLNDYFEEFGTDYSLSLKCNNGTFYPNTSKIYYLEADNKHCFVHLEDDTLHCNRTMARVFDVLPKNHFSKINRAFVVNLNFVKKYNKQEVLLNNQVKLRVGRTYLKSFKEEYHHFLRPKEI